MPVDVSLLHTFVGCNRVVGALDWGENGLIAFAAHHAVVLYDGNSQRVVGTLLGHADRVNCVRWLDKFTLISGAADGSLCLYRQQRKDCGTPAVSSWTVVARCPPAVPAAPITFIASTKWTHSLLEPEPSTDTNVHVLIITSGDGNISVWTVACAPELGSTSGPVELQRVDRLTVNNSSLPTCAAMMCGPSPRVTECKPYLLVAIGCVDGNVLLYTCHPPFSLKLACRLSGHTNWVRGVAFTSTRSRVSSDVSLLLATASQDRTVRLWRLVNRSSEKTTREVENRSLTRFAPKPHFSVNDVIQFEAQVEALLLGHEDWVHSVAWQPGKHESEDGDNLLETPTLLTTSMDRTMMLWVRDEATGLWLPRESVGDAGVNHLGYYTGVWSHDGQSLATHGFTGALHIWERENTSLVPRPACTGHYGSVVDATWSPDGEFLLTASTDQTVRVVGCLEGAGTGGWTELGRPQVHGHDLSCIAAIPSASPSPISVSGYKYASGAEEKVIRVFQSPTAFLETLDMARGVLIGDRDRSTAYGATLPALGLSNKAVFEDHDGEDTGESHQKNGGVAGVGADQYDAGPDFAPSCAPSSVGGRPLEEHLAQNTLWPEIHKLYGHGNELFCLAADPRGKYLASACKSQSSTTSAILLWDTATWTVIKSGIKAHMLTVTQLAFSPDGRYLASASRDRSFAVSGRVEGEADCETGPFRLISTVTKAHGRIIWGISWSPDSSLVFTASRDGFLGIWRVNNDGTVRQPAIRMIGFDKQSVRCVDARGLHMPGEDGRTVCLVAVGLESGEVVVISVTYDFAPASSANLDVEWREVWRSSNSERHATAVRKVAWRPQRNSKTSDLVLATCGDDHAVRLLNVCLN